MAETIKTNFALKPETVEGIEKLAELTHRGKSDVIDWLVADAIEVLDQTGRANVVLKQIDQA